MHLFLKFDCHSTRHTTVHFVHCFGDLKKKLKAINFENIIISGCVTLNLFCRDVFVYWANYFVQCLQLRTETDTFDWKVNNSQKCRKCGAVFSCINSECPSNDEFSH